MSPVEVGKILADFLKSIKDLRPNAIVQPSSDLPCTSGKLKYAHFVYGEELVKLNMMSNGAHLILMESYGIIDSFFAEAPEPINIKYREYLEGLKNGVITDFRMPNPFGECAQVSEYFNFLGECLHNENKGKLPDDVLGAFVYDALRNKAIKEKDIKLAKELVNTRLTRALTGFPGEKSAAESVFIK